MARGHFQRPCLKKCKMKGDPHNVVFIDVESDNIDDVIIIDAPDSSHQKSQGSSVVREDKNIPQSNIISIDDDESTGTDNPGIDAEGCRDLDSDATSSKSNHRSQSSVGSDGDECQFIEEIKRCKRRTYSGKAPCRNRYGLSPESESRSAESDCSDCEFMEGSSGKLREQWERASSKRKYNVHNAQSGLEDQGSASASPAEAHPHVEAKNTCELHQEVPVCSSPSDASNEREVPFVVTGDDDLWGASLNNETRRSFAQFNGRVDRESFPQGNAEPPETRRYFNGKGSDWFGGDTVSEDLPFSYGGAKFQNGEEQNSQGPNLWSDQDPNGKQCNYGEPCVLNSKPSINTDSGQSNANVQFKEASSCNSQHQSETQVNDDKVVSENKDEDFNPEHSSCNTHSLDGLRCETGSFGVEENVVPEKRVFRNTQTQPSDGIHYSCSAASSDGEVRPIPEGTPLRSKSEVDNENSVCHGNEKSVFEESSISSAQCNETHVGISNLVEEKEPGFENLFYNQPGNESNSVLHAKDGVATHTVERDIINERERLKETDEYKRATEEEWASRQRQLQIQAEEAQRLRKRRRAESMRLLDMERRQKQRLEEVRATQKQDEENLNMKEQFRVEIRNELTKLEMTCIDMASLLRGLGIQVGGGVYPLPQEVHAAYKRALLRFHPDRASRNNIRQQVEAEEKFKLISRMKEKLLVTS